MSLSTDFTTSINAIKADALKMHAIIHGTTTDVVVTEGGNVNSLAKTMRDLFADAETVFDDMRSATTDASPWGGVDGFSWDTVTWAGNKPATLAHSTATDSGEDAMMTVAIPADTARVRFRADIAGAYNWGGNGGMAPHLVLLDSEFNIILKSTPSVEYWTNGCQLLPGLRLDTSVACPAGTRYLAIYFDTGADGHGSYSGTMTYSVALTNMHVTTSTSVTIETLTSRAQAAQTAKTLTEGYRDAAWVAKLSAESSSAGANAAKLSAQEHRDDALTAKNAADTHANNAGIAAGAAQTSADNASGHATSAQTSAGNAQTYEGNAYTSSVNAADYEGNASTSKTNAASYEAGAYTAMLNAGNSNKVATDDPRLGLRGGVALTVGGAATNGGFALIAPFSLSTLMFSLGAPLAASANGRVLFATTNYVLTSGLICWVVGATTSLRVDEGTGSSAVVGTPMPVPAGTSTISVLYDAATNALSFYADSATSPFGVHVRINSQPLDPVAHVLRRAGGDLYSYTGTLRAVCALNFAATAADRIAAMRGEYPAKWKHGGTGTAFGKYAGDGTLAGNILTTATTGATSIALSPVSSGQSLPVLVGQKLRVRVSTSAPFIRCNCLNANGGVVLSQNYLNTNTAGGALTLEYTIAESQLTSGAFLFFEARDTDGTTRIAANITLIDWTLDGAQILVGPQDWARTRGVDMSGNCNDLIYGTGVVAIEPATKARVIAATAAGATVSAGAVATVGTLSGATYPDAKALAALRQWDAVTAHPAQSIPFQSTGLFVEVAANGTPTVKSGALGTNPTFAANYALKLVHNIQ